MAHSFQIYKDKAGEFRVRFKHNSETIFATEGYSSKANAERCIASIKKFVPEAPVDSSTDSERTRRVARQNLPIKTGSG